MPYADDSAFLTRYYDDLSKQQNKEKRNSDTLGKSESVMKLNRRVLFDVQTKSLA